MGRGDGCHFVSVGGEERRTHRGGMRRGSTPFGLSVLCAVILAVVSLVALERTALAQETFAYRARTPATESRWYGWQIILVDAATVGISLAAKDGRVAAAGYLGGAPLVHLAHLEPGHAGISLAVRAVAPLAGAALGYGLLSGVDCNGTRFSGCDAWIAATAIGAISGFVAASVVDVALLSREDVPIADEDRTPDARARRDREARRVRILPSVAPASGGAMAGFTGTF